jgi:putative DNA primase/helicase
MTAVHWTTLSDVPSQPVQWLWDGRIPVGKVTLLDGDPGSGKSLLALDLAARVSRGAAAPMSRVKPTSAANVVLFNDDDSLADTIRPRLEAAGADLSRIHCVDGEIRAEDLVAIQPALIVVDPLSTYLTLDSDCPPRRGLRTLSVLARETGAAVIMVQFLPKNGGWAEEIYDAARSVLQVSTIGHGRHRLALAKSNLRAPADLPPLVYHFEAVEAGVKITGWSDSV